MPLRAIVEVMQNADAQVRAGRVLPPHRTPRGRRPDSQETRREQRYLRPGDGTPCGGRLWARPRGRCAYRGRCGAQARAEQPRLAVVEGSTAREGEEVRRGAGVPEVCLSRRSRSGDGADLAIASIYVAKGQLEDAQDIFKQVLARDPRSLAAQIGLAQIYASG